MERAIFLDRDGVIIENVSTYVRSWADVRLLPGALDALARLCQLDCRIVLVTNHSVVGRGIITLVQAEAINQRLVSLIEQSGGRVDGVFLCPHAPQDCCDCRKPKPGLLFQAAAELSIDLAASVLVGDALTDLQAAQAAGIQKRFLVSTGRGAQQAVLPAVRELDSFSWMPSLRDVVDALVSGLLSDSTDRPHW